MPSCAHRAEGTPTALLETRYSREFETQADAFAIDQLRAHHISPAKLADMLEHIVAERNAKRGSAATEGESFRREWTLSATYSVTSKSW